MLATRLLPIETNDFVLRGYAWSMVIYWLGLGGLIAGAVMLRRERAR